MNRILIAVILLTAPGCYPLRNARFVDESQDKAKAWLCVPDDEPTNIAGIQCGDLRHFGLNLEKDNRPGAVQGPLGQRKASEPMPNDVIRSL